MRERAAEAKRIIYSLTSYANLKGNFQVYLALTLQPFSAPQHKGR